MAATTAAESVTTTRTRMAEDDVQVEVDEDDLSRALYRGRRRRSLARRLERAFSPLDGATPPSFAPQRRSEMAYLWAHGRVTVRRQPPSRGGRPRRPRRPSSTDAARRGVWRPAAAAAMRAQLAAEAARWMPTHGAARAAVKRACGGDEAEVDAAMAAGGGGMAQTRANAVAGGRTSVERAECARGAVATRLRSGATTAPPSARCNAERARAAAASSSTPRSERARRPARRARRRLCRVTGSCRALGLGRLVYDAASRGYEALGVEPSFFMLVPAHFCLNKLLHASRDATIFPFAHEAANVAEGALVARFLAAREVRLPGAPGAQPRPPEPLPMRMAAAEWEHHCTEPQHAGAWDAVVACFFVDATPDLLRTLRLAHGVLKPGGLLLNLGPLLYHNSGAEVPRLAADELVTLVGRCGFEVLESRACVASYSQVPLSMVRSAYRRQKLHFVARKAWPRLFASGERAAEPRDARVAARRKMAQRRLVWGRGAEALGVNSRVLSTSCALRAFFSVCDDRTRRYHRERLAENSHGPCAHGHQRHRAARAWARWPALSTDARPAAHARLAPAAAGRVSTAPRRRAAVENWSLVARSRRSSPERAMCVKRRARKVGHDDDDRAL